MKWRGARLAAGVAIALAAPGCPRLPPPLPRPAARVASLQSGGGPHAPLRARLDLWNRGAARLVLSAVDWELTDVRGDVVLARGRAELRRSFAPDERAAVAIDLAMAPSVAAAVRGAAPGGRARLRGTVHLEDPGGGEGAPASFDDPVTLPGSRSAASSRGPAVPRAARPVASGARTFATGAVPSRRRGPSTEGPERGQSTLIALVSPRR